jgi:RND family efflux transporter MFP subunit
MKNYLSNQSAILLCTLLALSGFLAVGCQNQDANQTDQPLARPVSYLTLTTRNPARQSLAAGSVVAWKKETIGFDVNGRIEFVMDQGANVTGPVTDGQGEIITPGTLIARMENRRYELAVRESEAAIQDAKARVARTQADYRRQLNIFKQGAGAQSFVDKAEAEFKKAKAQLSAVEANLRQAQIDAADTLLFAPFGGLVSRVQSNRGAYVERGNPVATIQMMDPVKVEFAVSPTVEQNLNYNDTVNIYLADDQTPILGYVYNKAPAAESATRTFRVELLVRNRLVDVGLPPGVDPAQVVTTPEVSNVESLNNDGNPPYMIDVKSLFEDQEGFYVWKVQGLQSKDRGGTDKPVFEVTKVRVKPGERFHEYVQVFTFREMEDIGNLDPARDLITGSLSGEVREGDTVALSRKRWLLRPGQIVRADFQYGLMNAGYYVPVQAVMRESGGFHVFRVEDKDETQQQAVRVAVATGQTIGTQIEITPDQAEALQEGARIVVDGAAYLRDGDPINAFIEVEVKL